MDRLGIGMICSSIYEARTRGAQHLATLRDGVKALPDHGDDRATDNIQGGIDDWDFGRMAK